jgi:bifunctional non-homologous end joining protein LigD
MSQLKIGRRLVTLSNERKILFPPNINKRALIDYYERLAPHMLPLIKKRLISMQRFPEGINKQGFFQKDASDFFPAWIETKRVPKEAGGSIEYVMVNNAATLVYLANLACITFHTWLSTVDKLDYPDRMIFDFDPSPGVPFAQVRKAALMARALLENLGLTPFVMTTGSRGLHVVVPIKRELPFDHVRHFAREVAAALVYYAPDLLTVEIRKKKRGKKIFVDFLRNAYGQTAVVPYSVRPLPGAPVAMPLYWEEVEHGRLSPQQWTIKNSGKRLERVGDPWKAMQKHAGSVKKVLKKLMA